MSPTETRGAFALIKNTTGLLLLVQRGNKADGTIDGRFNLPGGRVEPGETPAIAVIREVLEETGLIVRSVYNNPLGSYRAGNDVADTFVCEVVGGELKQTNEGVAFLWVDSNQFMELARRGDVPDGLVGGLKTSTGGVPRHIQMCLHAFTKHWSSDEMWRVAKKYCKELGISS